MIHHFSIPARDPARVARVLAELIGGRAYRFPGPLPGAAMAVSGDRHGTMIEIYPESVVMAPGDGEAPVAYRNAPGERSHAGFMRFCRCRTTVPPSNASARPRAGAPSSSAAPRPACRRSSMSSRSESRTASCSRLCRPT